MKNLRIRAFVYALCFTMAVELGQVSVMSVNAEDTTKTVVTSSVANEKVQEVEKTTLAKVKSVTSDKNSSKESGVSDLNASVVIPDATVSTHFGTGELVLNSENADLKEKKAEEFSQFLIPQNTGVGQVPDKATHQGYDDLSTYELAKQDAFTNGKSKLLNNLASGVRDKEKTVKDLKDDPRYEEVKEQLVEAARKQALIDETLRRCKETGENVPNWLDNCHSWVKTYMGYQAVTNTRSAQYALLNGEDAHTDMETGLRMVGNRYCIALGSFYTTRIGQKVDLVMMDGRVIHCILGDAKADAHTNETNQFGSLNGEVAEFIIDDNVYYSKCDGSGTVNWVDGLAGEIFSVVLVEDDIEDTVQVDVTDASIQAEIDRLDAIAQAKAEVEAQKKAEEEAKAEELRKKQELEEKKKADQQVALDITNTENNVVMTNPTTSMTLPVTTTVVSSSKESDEAKDAKDVKESKASE